MNSTKGSLIKYVRSSLIMLNDVNSFIFLRSKTGDPFLKEYKLGGGNLLSLIGQFAILNYISKIHFILNKGKEAYIGSEEVAKVQELKRNTSLNVGRYMRVPRLGEVNELEAFILLIMEYPKDIGIPKVRDKIEKVWKDLRNKISHLATIEVDNVAMTLEYSELEYPQIFKEAKKWTQAKPFKIIDPANRERHKAEIKMEDPNLEKPISRILLNTASDVVIVDLLNIAIQEISDWIIENISTNVYGKDHLLETEKWIEINFKQVNL